MASRGFRPASCLEDQGYFIVAVQLPDGASLERTEAAMKDVSTTLSKVEGVAHVVAVSGVSVLDNSASLANAGVAYIMLTPWNERGEKLGLLPMYQHLNAALSKLEEARIAVFPPPPIQGVGNAGGFTMQLELKDGSFDLAKLQSITNRWSPTRNGQSAVAACLHALPRQRAATFHRGGPRSKAESLHVTVQQVFDTLTSYLGSTYINQFNKFGRTFQVYTQADSQFRVRPADVENLPVRNSDGNMIPLGTVVHFQSAVGASLISLYNLYPSATIIGSPAPGYSSGQSMDLMEQIARRELPRGTGYDWTAMSYQEKIAGGQMFLTFGLALLLVYFVLAGQYESWLLPLAVILAVPLSLVGPVAVFTALRLDNNLYVQIGLVLLIALSAKNAILIVEFARDLHLEGHDIVEAAREAARATIPADPDDVFRLHPRRRAARCGRRCRRQRPQVDRHHRLHGHAGLDLPRGPVRAGLLRDRPEDPGAPQGQGADAGASDPHGIVSPGFRPSPRTSRSDGHGCKVILLDLNVA